MSTRQDFIDAAQALAAYVRDHKNVATEARKLALYILDGDESIPLGLDKSLPHLKRILHGLPCEPGQPWTENSHPCVQFCDGDAVWKPGTRWAEIRGHNISEHGVAAYLPEGYKVWRVYWDKGKVERVIIAGIDRAGWSLDGYVLPRLASGLFPGLELKEAPL